MTAISQRPADLEFSARAEPYRRELLAHCYRMTGSVHDAEDLVQETYLRAWRAFDRFEGRSSLRVWLHKIATMACLTALHRRGRRPLPSGLWAAAEDPDTDLPAAEPGRRWLQPVPDALVTPVDGDPADVVSGRATVRLAFVAALQHLPPRQRAVLILRDVVMLTAAETADVLGATSAAVNSALQRARAQLAAVSPAAEELTEPEDGDVRMLLDRYVAAFERSDVRALTATLLVDVALEMPPQPLWFRGRDAVGRFLGARVLLAPGGWRLLPTRANGQPAFAVYQRADGGDDAGDWVAHGVQLLRVARDGGGSPGVAHVFAANDPALLPAFGFPARIGGGDAERDAGRGPG